MVIGMTDVQDKLGMDSTSASGDTSGGGGGAGGGFRLFFLRGLAIVLPTVLTLWLVAVAYQFVQQNIASPINYGVRELLLVTSDWPVASEEIRLEATKDEFLTAVQISERELMLEEKLPPNGSTRKQRDTQLMNWVQERDDIMIIARRITLERWWNNVSLGGFRPMDLIGLVIAVVLIYFIGVLLSNYIGRRIYKRAEDLLHRVPLVSRVYPAFKQITDFIFGDDKDKMQFNRVVAVQYPRKGLWSVGLVTGSTMQRIQTEAGLDCLTVFIPSSPTPFTGYVITVPVGDTLDLPISIEEALKFAVSGGVLVPPSQEIKVKVSGVESVASESGTLESGSGVVDEETSGQ